MSSVRADIAVLGAGSWGTALAMQLARNGHKVVLWARSPQHVQEMAETRLNQRFIPDIPLPDSITPEANLENSVIGSREVLVAAPSHAFGSLVECIAPLLGPDGGVAWACKGFEPGTGRLLHEVAAEHIPGHSRFAAVTGPSFAAEVARSLPTAVTVAGSDEDYTTRISRMLHGESFRAYTSTDMVGAELGGAVKNVLAVATGIADGMKLGDNARAALVTRGLAEMMRLGNAMGARSETMTGLAGMGDLVLTCTGDLSRNRRLGLSLGQGKTVDETVKEIGQVIEGIGTSAEVRRLAKAHDVSMPISKQVHGIIHEGWNPQESVRRLLAREQKAEHDDE